MSTIAAESKTPGGNLDIEALIQQLEEEPAAREKLAALLAENRQSAPPLKMSYKEFLAWADEDTLAEVDALTQRTEFYQLNVRTGQYTLMPFDTGGVYCSAILPGFWLRADWLWQAPLPHSLHVLGAISGIDPQELERFMMFLRGER